MRKVLAYVLCAFLGLTLAACVPAPPAETKTEAEELCRAAFAMAEPTESTAIFRLNTAALGSLGEVISAVSRERYLLISGIGGSSGSTDFYLISADMAENRLLGRLTQDKSFGEVFLLEGGRVLQYDAAKKSGRLLGQDLKEIRTVDEAEAERLRGKEAEEPSFKAGFGLWRIRDEEDAAEYVLRKKNFSENLLTRTRGRFLTEEKGPEYTVYRFRNYREMTEITISTGDIPAAGTLYPNYRDAEPDSLIFRDDRPGSDGLFLWDLTEETATADPDCSRIGDDGLDPAARLAKQCAALEEKYGLKLLITEDELGSFSSAYSALPCGSEELPDYLDWLDRLLSRWPEGFFRELKGKSREAFCIGLCTELRENGARSANSAVTTTTEKCISVVLNVTRAVEWERTLAHEICHAMEVGFAEFAAETGKNIFEYWETRLNAPEYPYFYSYTAKGLGDTAGTLAADKTGARFIDAYSRTYPYEDRARILEALWMGEENAFLSPYLKDKALFLSALIRAAFPSVKGCETPPWEKLFGPQELPAV